MSDRPNLSRDEFLDWRSPRRGAANPERMNNPFWEWCVRSGENAWAANQAFDGPSSFGNEPCWCFDRFGQARVELPDGREVYIAGEHEDHYDPDFYIYNDVVIRDGDDLSIFGYSEEEFPPTDFHSATPVGEELVLIGNLGYPADRRPGETQVLRLDANDWQVARVATTGEGPGWIHGHAATLSADGRGVLLSGGKVQTGDDGRLVENIDDYRLCLNTLTWTRTTDRRWDRWTLEREDGGMNRLWEIRFEASNRELDLAGLGLNAASTDPAFAEAAELLAEQRERVTDEQIRRIATLYQSPFSEELAAERQFDPDADEDEDGPDDEFNRRRLTVDGVVVRFDEDSHGVTVTVEGDLPAAKIDAILSNLRDRLSAVEGTPYRTIRVGA